ncbi:MAG: 3-dehydroquinate synthase [Dictyoglomus sp.]
MSYPIYIGYDILKDMTREIIKGYSSAFIISHQFLTELYKEDIEFTEENILYVPVGENSKSFREVIKISKELVKRGADRRSILLAFGGGVIGDLTGFIASIYMRGVDFVQIPTTLLAQVDSSIGGKTGINISEGKNLIGTFYHPKAVIIDTKTLNTLPDREYRSGIAEVIKYGIIMDCELFEYLERNADFIIARNKDAVIFIIKRSLECKKQIVEVDEKENYLRMILNFGHTFGHAIEVKGRYKRFLHGEAVAIGMVMASEMAYRLGFCDYSVVKRVKNLLMRFGFPLNNPYKIENLIQFIKRDKKSYKGRLKFVLPTKIGEVRIVEDISEADVIRIMKEGDSYGK